MFKLVLEKAEEPEIILPTSIGLSKKQESSRKTYISALLTMPKSLTMWITTNYRKFLKKWIYQTTFPASWEICLQVRKQWLELDMEQTGSKSGKEYIKAVYCHPAYLTYMQSKSWETLGWMKHNLEEISIAGRNINKLRYADDTTLMSESEELKSLLNKVKEETEKVGLKLNIQKIKFVASGSITSWQIDGKTVETVKDFILGAPKSLQMLTAVMKLKDICSLGKKVMTNLDIILKSKDITLPTTVYLVKAMVFPVAMYGHETWSIKKS